MSLCRLQEDVDSTGPENGLKILADAAEYERLLIEEHTSPTTNDAMECSCPDLARVL